MIGFYISMHKITISSLHISLTIDLTYHTIHTFLSNLQCKTLSLSAKPLQNLQYGFSLIHNLISYSQQHILPQPIKYLYIELELIILIFYPKNLICPRCFPSFSPTCCFSFFFTFMLLFLFYTFMLLFLPSFACALTSSLTSKTSPFSSFVHALQN